MIFTCFIRNEWLNREGLNIFHTFRLLKYKHVTCVIIIEDICVSIIYTVLKFDTMKTRP